MISLMSPMPKIRMLPKASNNFMLMRICDD